MRGIAERVKERAELRVEVVGLDPHIGRGDDDVVREGSVPVDPDADGVDAQVTAARATVAAGPTDDVPFTGGQLPDRQVLDAFADRRYPATELMAQHEGSAHDARRKVVPLIEVGVGPAKACSGDADLDLAGARLGLGHVDQLDAGSGSGLDEKWFVWFVGARGAGRRGVGTLPKLLIERFMREPLTRTPERVLPCPYSERHRQWCTS